MLARVRNPASEDRAAWVGPRMLDFLSHAYLWTKSAHVVSMVAWMAGLFYLPRLFVYHAERASSEQVLSETFKVMEYRLLRYIMNPAMIATWVFGFLLLITPGVISWSSDLWIYLKLAAVLGLTWFHMWCAAQRRQFAADSSTTTGRTFRMMNEVPTLALTVIVVMVIVRPF